MQFDTTIRWWFTATLLGGMYIATECGVCVCMHVCPQA